MFKIIALETIPVDKTLWLDEVRKRIPIMARYAESRLLTIKDARYRSAMKILSYQKECKIYKFYRNYEKLGKYRWRKNEPLIGKDYFNKGSSININLCVVVGENGSGKSTILELILRLLNNTTYALQNGIESIGSAPLFFEEGIFARMYFENGEGEIFCIEQEDLTIKWINAQSEEEVWSYTHEIDEKGGEQGLDLKKDECKKILKSLFYTIVVNYSAYSLNIEDFRNEWIDCDERRLNELYSRQATTNGATTSKDDEVKYAEKCWLDSLFHKNDAYQTPIVLNPYRERGNIDVNKEKSLTNDRLFLMLLDNKDTITALLEDKVPHSYIFDRNEAFLPQMSDGSSYIFFSQQVTNMLDRLNIVANDYYEEAKEVGDKIIGCWEKCYGYKFVRDIEQLRVHQNDDEIAALNYVVYKTMKVTHTYVFYSGYQEALRRKDGEGIKELVMRLSRDYSHITLKLRRTIAFLAFKRATNYLYTQLPQNPDIVVLEKYGEIIEEMLNRQDELTNKFKNEDKIEGVYSNDEFQALELKIDRRLGENFKLSPVRKWTRVEFLPPPCISARIFLRSTNGDETFFDTLSSGEKQFIYALGTMMYQLHNLDITHSGGVQYDCVNLMFDEIDLYFHPKYQQQLIKRLMDMIERMKFNSIKHINIIMATHSPFILSDIPPENILYLMNGEDIGDRLKINPLGANINDILHHSFFLDKGFIGEYAKNKITELIGTIKSINNDSQNDMFPEIETMIEAIGDPFIREQLHTLYLSNRYKDDKAGEAGWLRNRLDNINNFNADNGYEEITD